jgi:hypothetical protein
LFSAPKLVADFLKKQELRKAKSEGTKTVINIGSPVCFQEFFGILETVNTQANYTLQSQKQDDIRFNAKLLGGRTQSRALTNFNSLHPARR